MSGRPKQLVVNEEIPWAHFAACKDKSTDMFFPSTSEDPCIAEAKKVCAGCLVKDECRAWGLTLPSGDEGIYGGLTQGERRKARRRAAEARVKAPKPPLDAQQERADKNGVRHGTLNRAMNYDCRCEPCSAALSKYNFEYRLKQKQKKRQQQGSTSNGAS